MWLGLCQTNVLLGDADLITRFRGNMGWRILQVWVVSGQDFLMAQLVKNLPAMQETWVWSLGGEDLLENGMAPHSRILSWEIPRTEEPGGLQSMELQGVGHAWATCIHSLRGGELPSRCWPFSRLYFHCLFQTDSAGIRGTKLNDFSAVTFLLPGIVPATQSQLSRTTLNIFKSKKKKKKKKLNLTGKTKADN